MSSIAPSPFGRQLRHWRAQRRVSQLDLAVSARSTPRHVSFLETGRSRPSESMVLRLAEALDVPLRARNDLLRAAGFDGRYPETTLDQLGPVRAVVEQILARHEPLPGFVIDRTWVLVRTTRGAQALVGGDAAGTSMVDLMLAPGGWRELIEDWPVWAWATVDRLRHEVAASGDDPVLGALLDRATALLDGVARPAADPRVGPVWCPTLMLGGQRVRTLTTVLTFGQPLDVTVEELRVELVFGADAESAALLEALGG